MPSIELGIGRVDRDWDREISKSFKIRNRAIARADLSLLKPEKELLNEGTFELSIGLIEPKSLLGRKIPVPCTGQLELK